MILCLLNNYIFSHQSNAYEIMSYCIIGIAKFQSVRGAFRHPILMENYWKFSLLSFLCFSMEWFNS